MSGWEALAPDQAQRDEFAGLLTKRFAQMRDRLAVLEKRPTTVVEATAPTYDAPYGSRHFNTTTGRLTVWDGSRWILTGYNRKSDVAEGTFSLVTTGTGAVAENTWVDATGSQPTVAVEIPSADSVVICHVEAEIKNSRSSTVVRHGFVGISDGVDVTNHQLLANVSGQAGVATRMTSRSPDTLDHAFGAYPWTDEGEPLIGGPWPRESGVVILPHTTGTYPQTRTWKLRHRWRSSSTTASGGTVDAPIEFRNRAIFIAIL